MTKFKNEFLQVRKRVRIITKNLSTMLFLLLLGGFARGANPSSTPIPSGKTIENYMVGKQIKGYPTPDWDHLKRGIDYVENEILVDTIDGITKSEEIRIRKKMASYGKVVFYDLKKLEIKFYEIRLTNGKTERQAIEELSEDPAVKYAGLNGIEQLQ